MIDKKKITKNVLNSYESMPDDKILHDLHKWDDEQLNYLLDSALDYQTKYPKVFKIIATIIKIRDEKNRISN